MSASPPHPKPRHTLSHPRRTGKKADLLPTRSLPHPSLGAEEEEEEGQSLARGPGPELRWASLMDTVGPSSWAALWRQNSHSRHDPSLLDVG